MSGDLPRLFGPPDPETVRLARAEAKRLLKNNPQEKYLSVGKVDESVVFLNRGPDWLNVTIRDRHPEVDVMNATVSYVYKRVHFSSTDVTVRDDTERHSLNRIDGFRYVSPQYVANEKRSQATEFDVQNVLDVMIPLAGKDLLDTWGRTAAEHRAEDREIGFMESTVTSLALLTRRKKIDGPRFITPEKQLIRLSLYSGMTGKEGDIFTRGKTRGRRFRDRVLLSARFTSGFRAEIIHPPVEEEDGLVTKTDIYSVEDIKDEHGDRTRGRTLTVQRRTSSGPGGQINSLPLRQLVEPLGTLALDETDIDPQYAEVAVSPKGRRVLNGLLQSLDVTMLHGSRVQRLE